MDVDAEWEVRGEGQAECKYRLAHPQSVLHGDETDYRLLQAHRERPDPRHDKLSGTVESARHSLSAAVSVCVHSLIP